MNAQCECCKEYFDFITPENEKRAQEEWKALFPNIPDEERDIVCEPCYIKILDFNEPGQFRYKPWLHTEEGRE